MTKAHLVVLGFLNTQPMYGYKIGQIVSERKFTVWSGIKLPSIYKAMQTLENTKHISGKEVSEGNNPPRTVYTITEKGKKYLREMLILALKDENETPQSFWQALSFTNHIFTKDEMIMIIDKRIHFFAELPAKEDVKRCTEMIESGKAPFVHKHLVDLGERFRRVQIKTLREVRDSISSDQYDDYFISNKEEI